MLSFLKGIFLPREDQELVGDVTTDDWAPLSSSVSNTSIQFAEWLQEDTPPARATSWPRTAKPRRSRPAGSLDFLSQEERHIVEQQQRAQRLEEARIQQARRLEEPRSEQGRRPAGGKEIAAQQARRLEEVEQQWDQLEPEPLVFDPAPDPPAIVTDEVMSRVKEQSSWIEVLKAYGEHLSDSELLVIRQQLSRDAA